MDRAAFVLAGISLALFLPGAAEARKTPSSKAVAKTNDDGRRYTRRAYPSAPPPYAHSVEGDVEMELEACLSCHENGIADATITPHPELPECRMCHVHSKNTAMFRPTEWTRPPPPKRVAVALPGAPPVIPHELTRLQSKCLSCHAGPSAIQAIPTPHPERVSCQQCHAPMLTNRKWSRHSEP